MAIDLRETPPVTTVERAPWWVAYSGPLLVAGGALAASAYVAFVDPNQPGHFPLCPLKEMTGLDCPGCGGLRAVHALLHGDLGTALDQNLFVTLLVLPAAVLTWLGWVLRIRAARRAAATTGTTPEGTTPGGATTAPSVMGGLLAGELPQRWRRWAPYAFLVVMVVFTVVRNLPWVPYLRSGLG